MITVTEKAAKKAIALAEKEGRAPRLRLGVKGGGCSDYSYFYNFDDEQRAGDAQWEAFGLQVVVDPRSAQILTETVFDYETNLLKGGFRFTNPQAKRSCSCGDSFSV